MLKRIVLKLVTPLLQKVFEVEPPVVPSSRTKFPTVNRLPGQPFRPSLKGKPYTTEKSGKIKIPPGDCLPGKAKEVAPGVYEKILPNGNKVTSRPSTSGPTTLEIKPPKGKNPSIKIRYLE